MKAWLSRRLPALGRLHVQAEWWSHPSVWQLGFERWKFPGRPGFRWHLKLGPLGLRGRV